VFDTLLVEGYSLKLFCNFTVGHCELWEKKNMEKNVLRDPSDSNTGFVAV